MKELIERLGKATGPDRTLEFYIAFAVRWRPDGESARSFAEHEAKHDYATAWIAHAPFRSRWNIPHYTASIDAALTLVPEGWMWDVASSGCAWIMRDGDSVCDSQIVIGGIESPAIAICIAALKARMGMER